MWPQSGGQHTSQHYLKNCSPCTLGISTTPKVGRVYPHHFRETRQRTLFGEAAHNSARRVRPQLCTWLDMGETWGKCWADKTIEPSQFATSGQLCTSAALTTCLFYDIHRQTREPAATAMLHATACFDRNLPALSIQVTRKYGMSQEAALFLFRALQAMRFRVRTSHGTSTESFSVMDNPDELLQGFGQGLGESSGAHVVTADVTNKALTKFTPGAVLQHLEPGREPVPHQKSLFMDDATLYANLAGITRRLMRRHGWTRSMAAAQALCYIGQKYSRYLWTTGGRLSLDKSYWYLLQFVRGKDGIYKLAAHKDSAFPMSIKEETANGQFITITQLAPDDARRGLGIVSAPDGLSTSQCNVLLTKARDWASSIRSSALNSTEIWLAYTAVLWPGLSYPLAVSSLSVLDLKLIQQTVSCIIRHSLGLNHSFPDALFYGAKRYGGLGIVPLVVQQCFLKLSLFSRHVRSGDNIGQALNISMDYTQLEAGCSTQFFRLDYSLFRHLLTDTWMSHLWEFLSLSNIQLWHSASVKMWLPGLQRVFDTNLVDLILASRFTLSHQRLINEWRMYFNALTVADLANCLGTCISVDIYYEWKSLERTSILRWPIASRPHTSTLYIWQQFLDLLTIGASRIEATSGPLVHYGTYTYRLEL